MRRHLPLALLLLAACFSPTPHVTEASYSSQVSTSEIALGLLDAGSFECRIDGGEIEPEEASRLISRAPAQHLLVRGSLRISIEA